MVECSEGVIIMKIIIIMTMIRHLIMVLREPIITAGDDEHNSNG